MKKKIHQVHEIIKQDENGNITEAQKDVVFSISKEPNYIKLYLDDIEKLFELPSNSSKLLLELLKKINYDGQIVLNATIKKAICEKLNYVIGTVDNYISDLCKKEIFKRVGTGVYIANPHIFGKGDWMTIVKQREAWIKIEYKAGKRVISTSFEEIEEDIKKIGG